MDLTKLNKFQYVIYDYGRYHRNIINIFIHIIFVPIITWSTGKLIEYYNSTYLHLPFNPYFVLLGLSALLFLNVDSNVGLLTTFEYFIFQRHINPKFEGFGFDYHICLWIIWVVSWLFQFIGHGFFEGRKPALIDNILQVLNAPIFVNVELMFFLFGYRKEEISEANKYIAEDISKYKSEKKNN